MREFLLSGEGKLLLMLAAALILIPVAIAMWRNSPYAGVDEPDEADAGDLELEDWEEEPALAAATEAPAVAGPPATSAPPPALAPIRLLPLDAIAYRMLKDVPQLAVYGSTGAGKTEVAKALIRLLERRLKARGEAAEFPILDIKNHEGRWGLPAIGCDDEGGYGDIAQALDRLWHEWRLRILGWKRREPIKKSTWIVWDEINDTIDEAKDRDQKEMRDTGKRLRRWLRLGRELRWHLIIFPQNDTGASLGLDGGHAKTKNNVGWIYLGGEAAALVRRLESEGRVSAIVAQQILELERPAVFMVSGEPFALDVSDAKRIASRPVDQALAWDFRPQPRSSLSPETTSAATPVLGWTDEQLKVAAWMMVDPTIGDREVARRLWPEKSSGGANAQSAAKLKAAVQPLVSQAVMALEKALSERENAKKPAKSANKGTALTPALTPATEAA